MSTTVTEAESPVLAAVAAEFDQALAARITAAEWPDNLQDAVRHALGGGKRLRPCLTILCCEAVGGARPEAVVPAIALELVHCFSLVHDDLPAMDDDDLRRGRPSLHVHSGEAMAILAGDVMLASAFELITTDPRYAERPAAQVQLVRELATATTSMVVGQVYDTLGGFPESFGERDRLHLTHRNKTGALLRAACRMGGIAGGAGPERLEALTRYGEAIGLMFQIVDDLLDVTQSAEHIGKATGKDERAGKLTFPGLLGIDRSRQEVERLRQGADEALAILGHLAAPLRQLGEFLAVRTR